MALPACGVMRSVNGGVFALPTAGDHVPVGGMVSGHYGIGAGAFAGVDGTVRATADYAHAALGVHGSVVTQNDPVGPYGRLGFAPVAASLRDGTFWYAMNTSLEFGFEFPFGRPRETQGMVTDTNTGSAWTLGLRGDLEYRPAQGGVDVFVSLVVGALSYEFTSPRGFSHW